MTRLTSLTAASLVVLSAACKKEDKAGGEPGKAPAAQPAKDPGKAPPAGDAVEQKDLKVELAGKPMGPLYGVAQLAPDYGNTYQMTFVARPVDCATFEDVMMSDKDGTLPFFTLHANEALKPDGTTTWAYRQIAHVTGATAPAGLVAMAAFEVKDGKATGTLPPDVHHDGASGKLTASGSFAVPVCDPIKPMKLRDYFDATKDAPPIEAKGSTMKVTVAGKAFDVKGATAVPSPGGTALDIRLSGTPHGCAFEVRDDLYVSLLVGADEPSFSVGGHWMAGGTIGQPTEGLTVDWKASADTGELTVSGKATYQPEEANAYPVEIDGKVTVAICKEK